MRLRDFISETISEIAFGVHKAKIATKDLIAVSPGHMNGDSVVRMSEVEFDVAVTIEEATGTSKGGDASMAAEVKVLGLQVSGGLGGSAEKATEAKNSKVSRVAFKVPVYLNAHMRNDPTIEKEGEIIAGLEADQ